MARPMTTDLLTKRQLASLANLPADHRVVGARRGTPLVQRANGQLLRIQPNGRLVATTASVSKARSYLELERC